MKRMLAIGARVALMLGVTAPAMAQDRDSDEIRDERIRQHARQLKTAADPAKLERTMKRLQRLAEEN